MMAKKYIVEEVAGGSFVSLIIVVLAILSAMGVVHC
jgi:cell division protein FtsL